MYVIEIGGAVIGKMFIVIAISQSLIHLYNNMFGYDPCQLKGIIILYTRKVVFNAGSITLQFAFHLPFNKSKYILLKGEKIDTLTKHCEQLCIMLIDKAYLINSTLLYHVDKRLRKIKHTLLAYFGYIDIF